MGPVSFKDAQKPENQEYYVTANDINDNSSIWEIRAFLYNQLYLNELFSGDGYTHEEDGSKGLPEYFMLNQRVDELPGARLVDRIFESQKEY